MSIRSQFNEQLEAYISGEMKGADRLVFEGHVESNPILKAEFDYQMDIIESLKSRRKSELKTRLSNISVEPTLIGAFLQSSLVKPVIYGLTSLTLVTGTYLFYNTKAATNIHLKAVEGKMEYLTASNINIDFKEKIDFVYNPSPVKNDIEYSAIASMAVDIKNVPTKEEKEVLNQIDAPQALVFEIPNMETEQEEDFNAPNLGIESTEKVETETVVTVPEKISINQVNSRKYHFHYRIEDNRLFLYGKFDESPYEIIEVNGRYDKKIYFYYNGDFFHLRKGATDITKLSRINDTHMIQRLDLLKSNYNN
ncbi:hypothetical protein [Reichenbachiella versicolor]|uniref:hypothetical protein n=1 Tax=Reichenbachiella versicolor TaxID=1821036 RepID=UPI000D6E2DC3|nr:hypothetical protein [Reichenbachiella versicolor]